MASLTCFWAAARPRCQTPELCEAVGEFQALRINSSREVGRTGVTRGPGDEVKEQIGEDLLGKLSELTVDKRVFASRCLTGEGEGSCRESGVDGWPGRARGPGEFAPLVSLNKIKRNKNTQKVPVWILGHPEAGRCGRRVRVKVSTKTSPRAHALSSCVNPALLHPDKRQ